jgi:hypothetical protein
MLLKSFVSALLLALACTTFLTSTAIIAHQEMNQTTTRDSQDKSEGHAHLGIIPVGDPVPGGGPPSSGTQIVTQTA